MITSSKLQNPFGSISGSTHSGQLSLLVSKTGKGRSHHLRDAFPAEVKGTEIISVGISLAPRLPSNPPAPALLPGARWVAYATVLLPYSITMKQNTFDACGGLPTAEGGITHVMMGTGISTSFTNIENFNQIVKVLPITRSICVLPTR